MEYTNKITEKQLETIVNQQKDLNALLSNIGVLESQKHGFLHQIAEVNKKIEEFKSELQEEYGDININIEDGSYTYINKPEEVTLEKVD
jgi:predicted  nucleic acid-binding Zn-ribbon protein